MYFLILQKKIIRLPPWSNKEIHRIWNLWQTREDDLEWGLPEVSNGCSEEPADINATSRKAKNTKDDRRTIKKQSGTNRKGWKVDFWFFLIENDWKWFRQKDVIYNTEQRATGRESGLDSATEVLETRQRVGDCHFYGTYSINGELILINKYI